MSADSPFKFEKRTDKSELSKYILVRNIFRGRLKKEKFMVMDFVLLNIQY